MNKDKKLLRNKRTGWLYILILLFIIFANHAVSQQIEATTDSKKALRAYQKALDYYDRRQTTIALEEIQKAISADPVFVEAYMVRAGIHTDMEKYDKAIDDYKKAIELKPQFALLYFYAGVVEAEHGIYEDGKKHLEMLLSFDGYDTQVRTKAEKLIATCTFAINAIKNPVPFLPVNMGSNVNNKDHQYLPTITADEQTLIITVREPATDNTWPPHDGTEENFYISKKIDGRWAKAKSLGPPINTYGNEGAQCISADGQILIYTACDRPDGLGRCDLYFAFRTGDNWSKPMNIGSPVNSRYWDSQPSLSSDGRTLYFVSNRPGGKGGRDIWQSTLNGEGVWGEPVNMGDKINTEEEEQSPFIHPDNQTLYFASSGLTGMGGEDLFIVRKQPDDTWGEPVNLGYPINTFADESSLIVSASGNTAYFASSTLKGEGGFDLYSFELYDAAKPKHVTYVKGKVYDSITKENKRARFELIDLATSNIVAEAFSNSTNGEFLVCLPVGKEYALNVSKKNYVFYSEHFSLEEPKDATPYMMDVPLQPIMIGSKVILKNIFYETNSFELKEKSKSELNKLVDFLNSNPSIKVEIGGHTDDVGNDKSNQTLSENRAKTVYLYIIVKSIDKERLTYKGYGKTSPVAENDSEQGRAMNRRTEYMIIAK